MKTGLQIIADSIGWVFTNPLSSLSYLRPAQYNGNDRNYFEGLRTRARELSESIQHAHSEGAWSRIPERAKRARENASVLYEQLQTIRAVLGERR
jgi:hypothetical protein